MLFAWHKRQRLADKNGTLQHGKDADIVVMDRNLNVRCVWKNGITVPGTDKLNLN